MLVLEVRQMFFEVLLPPYPPGALGRGRVKEVLAWSIAGRAALDRAGSSCAAPILSLLLLAQQQERDR